MGIRFYCPNGHKLNVKTNLAGKTGFCPECGVRLTIPHESTRQSSKSSKSDVGEPTANGLFSLTPSSFFAEESNSPNSFSMESAEQNDLPPILRDTSVVWYIQVPNGPQYGPATGEVVNTWLQEQRIGPNMLVWREGWENWLEAKNVFTDLE
ncbi:MAG: DUF4339 domain-containing protein [Thermoguttaceae bacterium]